VQVSSFLVKWRATVEARPSHTRFGVDAESVRGDFVLTVAQDQPPIPDIVLDCADAVHVDLRDAGSAAGSKVTWTEGRGDLSTRVSADPVLARDKTADYRYETMRESAELAASPETESPALVVQASVRRNDVEKARDLFTKLLLDQIPGKAGSVVRSLAKPLLDAATDRLDALTDETATGRTFVTYHTPPAKQSPAPGGSSPAPANTVVAHFPTRCPGVDKIAIASPRPNNGGPWVFDGDILPPKSLPKGAFTCGYSAPLGGVDPVTGYQTAEQIGLFIFPDIEPMPAGAKPVTVRGADQAWWEGGILKVVVGDRTLGVSVGLRVTANQIQQGVSVAEEVLGTR
jgi:hypothetical protein